jgi:hypothetical protein
MRAVFASVMLVAATALCGCASDQVPSWAIAAAQSQYRPARFGAKHDSRETSVKTRVVRPALENLQVTDITTDIKKTDTKLVPTVRRPPDQKQTANVPSKYKDLAVRLQQWDRRQEEENRRINMAIAICRC